jgi:hypothetical protein
VKLDPRARSSWRSPRRCSRSSWRWSSPRSSCCGQGPGRRGVGAVASKPKPRLTDRNIVNGAIVLYLSAIAVAIGFRMNLFNIGVDGQYRVAAFAAAVFAGQAWLPGWLNIIVSLLVAMLAGGLWAEHRRHTSR